MVIGTNDLKPIYVKIAEWLENEIIIGHFQTDEKIYSQYQLADMYMINPATAAKGLSMLAETGVLYKKRGLGMYVSPGAKEKIISKRKNDTLRKLIDDLVTEASRLQVPREELIQRITETYDKKGESE